MISVDEARRELSEDFWTEQPDQYDNSLEIQQLRTKFDLLQDKQVRTRQQTISASPPAIQVSGNLGDKEVALTFDDGPHPRITPVVLATLQQFKVRCNFFQLGVQSDKFPEQSASVAQAGHSVGSHSYSHPHLTQLSESDAHTEIVRGRETVSSRSGSKLPFFRFPYGAHNEQLNSLLLTQEKLHIFSWNIDPEDWNFKKHEYSPLMTYKAIVTAIDARQQGIVVMHDIQPQTAYVLPDVLRYLRLNHYTVVHFT